MKVVFGRKMPRGVDGSGHIVVYGLELVPEMEKKENQKFNFT